MFSKKNRATTEQVKEALQKGTSKHSENFSVRAITKPSPTTVAVVVSKKVAATAVERNKLKRRTREILKRIALPRKKTIVVYLKQGAKQLSPNTAKNEIQDLLKG